MFQPETEDMLPRMAPKPSAAVPLGSSEGIVRPQVPEVSILFGQQELNSQNQHDLNKGMQLPHNAQPTYATWKKQMLPKVTFPPNLVSEPKLQLQDNLNNNNMMPQNYNSTTNLYPFRSIAMSTAVQASNSGVSITNNPIMYRRSLESCNPPIDYSQMPQMPTIQALPQALAPPIKSNSGDVLTICAGTQTDKALDMLHDVQTPGNVPWSNFVTRRDIEDVRQMLEEMKHEQERILKILETFILNSTPQMSSKPQTSDAAVQIGIVEDHHTPYNNCVNLAQDLDQDQDLPHITPKNKFIQHLKSSNNVQQTPKGKPIAQSTTYQPNSPQTQRLQGNVQEFPSTSNCQNSGNKEPAVITRSASDTSLAMNELALKYLPSEKLAELLKELDMDCGVASTPPNLPAAPIRSAENKFEKGPSDISNASYKYLKKYRLLPEDSNNENDNVNDEVENENNHMLQYNSPQYNVRNAPINQRHTPTNKNSPYTGRLPLSPLARASTPPQQIVNLENIKHQPKFL
ncbi:hypothetical protein DOY81_001386 [Sarcophaga bullata]|nr:hypothetical protein DOY81_001386 [Sarcophaga bullata]